MTIFELTAPGTWLEFEDRDRCREVDTILQHLRLQFFEANVALNLFTASNVYSSMATRTWGAEMEKRSEIQKQVEAELGRKDDNWDAVLFETNVRYKREQWKQGQVPRELESPIKFIYARAFLYAVDSFAKFLGALAEVPGVPSTIAELVEDMAEAFPSARLIRNSAQHLDERARGLGGYKKPLNLKPIDNGTISAPSGGVLVTNFLNDSKYGCTMANGHYGEIDVSPASMEHLQGIMQAVYDSFEWSGPKCHYPY